MKSAKCLLVSFVLAATTQAEGQIVVSHSADRSTGFISDTEVPAGWISSSIQSADDFDLGTAAKIQRVVWWGYY